MDKQNYFLRSVRNVAIIVWLISALCIDFASAQDLVMRRQNSVGPWRAKVWNNGTLFHEPSPDPSVPGYPAGVWQMPDGSWDSVVYGAGLWIGGLRSNGNSSTPHVEYAYSVNDASTMFMPGSIIYGGSSTDTSEAGRDKYRVYRSSDVAGPAWPVRVVNGEADYIDDVNSRITAGRKATYGDEDMFVVYKDSDPLSIPISNPDPLNLEIRTQLSFSETGPLKDAVIVRNQIIYRGSDVLLDPVIGVAIDGDIQTPDDDRLKGVRSEAGAATIFFTNGSTSDPMLGVTAFSGMYGTGRATAGITTLRYWDLEDDPRDDSSRYAFLVEPRRDTALSAIGDARVLLSSLSHTALSPGDTVYFDYALFASAPSSTGAFSREDSLTMLHKTEAITQAFHNSKLKELGVARGRPVSKVSLFPNPASDYVRLVYSERLDQPVLIEDILGRVVRSYPSGATFIDLRGLADGLYYIRIEQSRTPVQHFGQQ